MRPPCHRRRVTGVTRRPPSSPRNRRIAASLPNRRVTAVPPYRRVNRAEERSAFTPILRRVSVDRLSSVGIAVPRVGGVNGQKEVRGSPGPMGRCVDDLEVMMGACCAAGADATLPPLRWDREAYAETAARPTLKFGYFVSDGWFEPAPACRRAVEDAVAALRAAGHHVVEFAPLELAEAAPLYVGLLASGGKFADFTAALEGEALHPMYSFLRTVARLPNVIRPPLAWMLRVGLHQPRRASLVRLGGGKTAAEFWALAARRDQLRRSLLARFESEGLDALLCPTTGLPAWPLGKAVLLNQACSYTHAWNNFNLPAGSLPVTNVRADEQHYADPHNADSITAVAAAACEGSVGLPVGVQVVALPWRDEACLGAMRALEIALGKA